MQMIKSMSICEGTDKTKLHEELCTKLHDTYIRKNSDYGDSFGKSYDKYGITAAMVRMEDKWNRMENLVTKDTNPLVGDESLKDTILDLANYAIMTYIELIIRKPKLRACEVNTIQPIAVDETLNSMDESIGESEG